MHRSLFVAGAALAENHRALLARALPKAAAGALSLVIAVQVVWLALALRPLDLASPPSARAPATGAENDAARGRRLETLAAAHLFGEASSAPSAADALPAATAAAPDTALDLTLTGVLLAENGMVSRAIIGSRGGAERSYGPGDLLESGIATLHEVYEDRVILERDGQLETLRPRELEAGASGASPPLPRIADAAAPLPSGELLPSDEPLAIAPEAAAQFAAAGNEPKPARPQVPGASPLSNVLRLSMYNKGSVVGLRASPGRDAQTFRDLGLKAGDVITSVNGAPLGGAPNGGTLFRELERGATVTVSVVRDGVPQVVTLPGGALGERWAQR